MQRWVLFKTRFADAPSVELYTRMLAVSMLRRNDAIRLSVITSECIQALWTHSSPLNSVYDAEWCYFAIAKLIFKMNQKYACYHIPEGCADNDEQRNWTSATVSWLPVIMPQMNKPWTEGSTSTCFSFDYAVSLCEWEFSVFDVPVLT